MNNKRSYSQFNKTKTKSPSSYPNNYSKWRKEDSDQEGDSYDELEMEEEDEAVVDELRSLLRALLEECRKLSTQLSSYQVPPLTQG